MKKILCSTILLGLISTALAADLDTARIDELTGLKGKMNDKEGVYKVTLPRNDVKVVVDGWAMPPFMGLGTWAAFTPTQNGAMVMGDTVLFEDEVNAAMSAALDSGLNITALHNHFFFDRPKVYFMKWITREKIKVDRVACPWLIQHFVDSSAEFIFLPHDTDWTKIDDGIVFDVPNCELGHHGEDVSFNSILKKYGLTDPALVLLGEVVRAADSHPRNPHPAGEGLRWIAGGFGALGLSDHVEQQVRDAVVHGHARRSDRQRGRHGRRHAPHGLNVVSC